LPAIDASYGCVDWYFYQHADESTPAGATSAAPAPRAPGSLRGTALAIDATG
jgi:hypothetical protein